MSEAHFRLGVLDEEDLAFASALRHFRSAIALVPASVWSRAAGSRILWISQRSEGGYLPLAALQRVRLDPAKLADPAELDRLARAAAAFPPGRVRVEARILLAASWLKSAAHREDALANLREIVSDPHAGRKDALYAERDLVGALLADGRVDDALAQISAHPLDPKLGADVERLARRRTARHAAFVALAVALVAAAILFGLRRRIRK